MNLVNISTLSLYVEFYPKRIDFAFNKSYIFETQTYRAQHKGHLSLVLVDDKHSHLTGYGEVGCTGVDHQSRGFGGG